MTPDPGSDLTPELISAIEAAVALRPDAFETRESFIEEAVSRLVDTLAEDPAAFAPRGVNYESIRRLLDSWMDSRLQGPGPAPRRRGASLGTASLELTRHEFAEEALVLPREDYSASPLDQVTNLAQTAILPPPAGVPLQSNGPGFELSGGPLFGLHNRDYPSLWAAADLYREASAGPVDLDSYMEGLVERGWAFGELLGAIERATGLRKLQALFPSNRNRAQSAEEGFRAFAFGSVHSIRGTDRKRLTGPLYQWQLARVIIGEQGRLAVGRTLEGENLLDDLAGISLAMPHDEALTRTFLRHLMEFAPGDWEVFRAVLALCANSPHRTRLVESLREQFAERNWSPSAGSSYAVGYVGRAREWGLLEERLSTERTYELTELGREYAGA